MSSHSESDASREIPIAEFVRRLKPDPRGGLLALRALALSLGPDVSERVTAETVTYERREKPFLIVESSRSRLVAAFPAGVDLNDPLGRLLRRGEERYVKVAGAADLDAHVQEFIRKAYVAAR